MTTLQNSAENLWKKLPWSLALEGIWLLPAAAASWFILKPVIEVMEFKYLATSLLFLLVAFTYFRHLLFFRSLLFYRYKWVKFGFFVVNLHLFVLIINLQENLLLLVDLFDIQQFGKLRAAMDIGSQGELIRYLSKVIKLSATSSLLLIVLMELRLIFSYWKVARVRFSDMMQE